MKLIQEIRNRKTINESLETRENGNDKNISFFANRRYRLQSNKSHTRNDVNGEDVDVE